MIFQRKKYRRLAERLETDEERRPVRQVVWRRFTRGRRARWALRLLGVLLFFALFADFIANDKPLWCRIDGRSFSPVLHEYAVGMGLDVWEARFVQADWHELPYETVVYPPVPYSARKIDRSNMKYRSPFGEQRVESWRFRHWLGTDQTGRDVAAGLIHGTRTALFVGLIAMAIATFIGLLFGAVAGYFGDERLRLSRFRLWSNLIALAAGFFYGFGVRGYALREGVLGWELLKSLGVVLGFLVLANLLSGLRDRLAGPGRRLTLPADLLVMRLIEVVNAVPTLLLLLSVVAIVREPSIFYIMAIIGLLSWTGIARFVRAELLRIRRQEYVEAGHALGFSDLRILLRHALPNALTPVLIAVAFGIAGAILLEAFLSFLGIGLAADAVTWGTLLSLARRPPHPWWLALFPGLAIFVTVTVFNLLGEALSEALDPRRRER